MTITDYYVTTDAMGSVTAILDEDGTVLERRSYDAFGEMTCLTPDGAPVEVSPTGVDVGFHAQLRDEVTGLYQMGFRCYSPSLGRWLSRDLIGLVGGVNESMFVDNRSISGIDPYGLFDIAENTSLEMRCSEIDNDLFLQNAARIGTMLSLARSSDSKCLQDVVRGTSSSEASRALVKFAESNKIPVASFKLLVAFGHGSAVPGEQGIIKYTSTVITKKLGSPMPVLPHGAPVRLPFIILTPQQSAYKIKKYVDGVLIKPNAILLVSCYGADGVAQAVADTMKIPVVATSGVVWCRRRADDNSVRLYPVRRKNNGEGREDYVDEMNRSTEEVFSEIETSSSWRVVFPHE